MKIKNTFLPVLSFLLLTVAACFAQTPTQTLSVPGLKENVNVRRDARGIPYIEAKNDADLFFAQGFITAQDRLWQMDLYRRVARGETAEIFGRAILEEDKRWRKFGFAGIAEETVRNAAPETRALLENYARGVNAYISTREKKTLPVEFQILQYSPRQWSPADSIIVSKIFDDALSNTWRLDLMKADLMNLPKEKLVRVLDETSPLDVLLIGSDKEAITKSKTQSLKSIESIYSDSLYHSLAKIEEARKQSLERIGFYAEDLAASNNWVVSGKRTVDGKPLLANDPHLRATQPPIWYLVNLSSPNLKVAGVSTAGIPGVIIGHNENVAWGSTNVGPDVQDLYLEIFDASGKYKTPDGWATPVIRKEEIKVRKNVLSPETETEILEVTTTRNGVIVLDEAGGKRYALKWTAFDSKNDSLTALSRLAKSKNWSEFRAALKSYAGAMQNFVYADKAGNIGWVAAGKVPLRKTGDGSLPYNGATNDGDWTGFIPFEELPQLYNPPQGFIVTANQRTVGKSYKYHDLIARTHTPARAKRLFDLLNREAKVSADDMSAFQMDTFSVINARFAREVVNQKGASDGTLNLLANWDGRMTADSKAALVADSMRNQFRSKILTGTFGAEKGKTVFLPFDGTFFDNLIIEKPKDWLPKEFTNYADLLQACEIDALDSIVRQSGGDESKQIWGGRAKINIAHPLAIAPLIGAQFLIDSLPQNGSGGAAATPNVGAAVSMRFIATPANWDLTRQVIPTGESGDPKSPHYKDQLQDWYKGTTPVFPFTKSAIEKAAIETILLTP